MDVIETTTADRLEPSPWTRRFGLAAGLLLVTWGVVLAVVAVQVREVGRLLPRHPGFTALLAAYWACIWGWVAIGCWGARLAHPRRRGWWTFLSVAAALTAAWQVFLMVAHHAEWLTR